MSWHDQSCAGLDLHWAEDQPGCRRCNRWAPTLPSAAPLPPPMPPRDTNRMELSCTWPPCLAFTQIRPSRTMGSALALLENDETRGLLPKVQDVVRSWAQPSPSAIGDTISMMPTPKRSAEERQASDATTGIYSRLRKFDIRLLRLHGSSKRTSPVHCSLEVHGLRDPCCPIFEALSYTWADSSGDNSLRQPIFLGANYCVLAVTNNCMSALRTFRNEVDRLLWVDSICINQKSQSEREAQVALMPRIYSSASRVLMYLEDNSSTADQAMTALVESDNVPSTNVESPLDMQSLLINNYFTRTWMVQEVSLAKSATVTLGNRTVHWSSFKAAALAPATRSNAGHRKTWIEHGDIGYHGKPTLLEYLHSIRHCRCGDPRDQIYAVLGLTQNEREQLSIDYSISVQQLYMGLALYWISSYEYGFLDAIGLKKSIPSLPSWVPDWTSVGDWDVTNHLSGPKRSSMASSSSNSFVVEPPCISNRAARFVWTIPNPVCKAWAIDSSLLETIARNSKHRQPSTDYQSRTRAAFDDHQLSDGMGVGREVGYLVLDAFPLFFANDKTLHPNVVGKNTLWFDDNEDVPRMRCDLTQSGLDGLYPYVLMDLRRGFLLRRHASSIFSLHSSFQITCEPPPAVHTTTLVQFYNMLGVPPPPQLSPDQAPDSSDNEVRLHDLDLVKLHKDLIAAETAIVDQWLCDLFYFGSKAGVDVAAKIYPSDPRNWHCVLPNATHACWTYDSYRYQRQALSIRCTPQQLQAMRQLQEEIMQTFPKHEQALMMEKTLMYTRDAYWGLEASHPLFWQLHRVWNSHIKADPDAIPVAALDLGYADHIRRTCAATISTSPASVDDVIADWSSIVKRLRDSCRTYGPMSAALRDAHRSGFRPAFMVSNRMQDDEFDEFEDGIVSFLRPLSGGDIQINRKTVLSEAWIVVHAWAILENLQLQEDVSAEQNCNIMWIHIVTLDMMVQLRGLLHHRRIVKCLDDAAKNVERIVLI